MTITFDSKAWKVLYDKIDFLEKTVKIMASRNSFTKWIDEEEAMLITGLSRRSLNDKRVGKPGGVFNYSSASGRKIKYLRKDCNDYLDNNSTLGVNKPTIQMISKSKKAS